MRLSSEALQESQRRSEVEEQPPRAQRKRHACGMAGAQAPRCLFRGRTAEASFASHEPEARGGGSLGFGAAETADGELRPLFTVVPSLSLSLCRPNANGAGFVFWRGARAFVPHHEPPMKCG